MDSTEQRDLHYNQGGEQLYRDHVATETEILPPEVCGPFGWGLRDYTQLLSRGFRHTASLALWLPELCPSDGQLGLKAYMSLCQTLWGTVRPLLTWTVIEPHRESPGRTEETMASPDLLTWMPWACPPGGLLCHQGSIRRLCRG